MTGPAQWGEHYIPSEKAKAFEGVLTNRMVRAKTAQLLALLTGGH